MLNIKTKQYIFSSMIGNSKKYMPMFQDLKKVISTFLIMMDPYERKCIERCPVCEKSYFIDQYGNCDNL